MAKGKYLSNGQYYGFNVTSVNGQTGDVNVPTVAVSDTQPASNADIWIDTSEPSGESGTVVTKIGNAYGEVTLDANSMSMNNNVLGSKLNMDLLWKNASHTSTFAGQTVTLDLSNYSRVYIIFKVGTDATTWSTNLIETDGNFYICASYYSSKIATRRTKANNSGVTFEDGKWQNTYGTETTANNVMIPYKVYGIK